jgi:hypothetical protein
VNAPGGAALRPSGLSSKAPSAYAVGSPDVRGEGIGVLPSCASRLGVAPLSATAAELVPSGLDSFLIFSCRPVDERESRNQNDDGESRRHLPAFFALRCDLASSPAPAPIAAAAVGDFRGALPK